MKRRDLLRLAGAGIPGLLGGQAPRPNVVFVLADDLGWGDLGCYGNRQIQTPHLDRLAREGSLFTQFYVNSAVCSPSRTAFMTGQYPARHRIHGHLATPELNRRRDMPDWLDPAAPLLPRCLKEAGYRTAHFGKWHLGSGPGAPLPSAYGFDEFRTVNGNGPGWEDEADPGFRARSSRLIVDEAIRFIEKNRDNPFYMNVWSLVPHATLNPTAEQMAPYRRYGPTGVPHAGASPVFYASVSDLDAQVGRLIARLDELGLGARTLVVFSSDNGPEEIHIANANHSGVGSPGPFRGRKRSLYEGGVRVPFLVRWPGHASAGRIDNDSVITGVDFLPTVCRLAGVSAPAGYSPDGEDRSGVLLGAPGARVTPIYWEWRFRIMGHVSNMSPRLVIRDGRWKLLMNPDRSRIELYDIPADPRETRDLAAARPEIVKRLSERLLAWHARLPPGMVEPEAGRNDYPWPAAR